ncbi:histone acetyltransferases subunit 3-domain-containing protein [Gigaspora margarita]|uniref:Histone acetyltransferases subunit 3-domain-containing protein n=1 Tax=Gigaspora margarita TaxID=4874 RepID=A0A8H3X7D1_GIGMA|nr:histone acetyltransferases subunit 3-domain-containing protein [Gigaspora margarita]
MDQKSFDPKSFVRINIPSKSARRRSSNNNSTFNTSLQTYNKHDLQSIKKDLKNSSISAAERKLQLERLMQLLNTLPNVGPNNSAAYNGSAIHSSVGKLSGSTGVRPKSPKRTGSPSIHRLGSPSIHRTGSPSIHRTGSPSIHKSTSKEKGSKKRGSIIKVKKDDSDLDEYIPTQRKESIKTSTSINRKKKKRERISDDDSESSSFEKLISKNSRNSTPKRNSQNLNSTNTARGSYKKRKRSTTETTTVAVEDAPVVKSTKDQVAIKTFYEHIDTYIRDYTEEDIDFLESKGVFPLDDDEKIPKLGKHYLEVWAEEERNLTPQTAEELEARQTDTIKGPLKNQDQDLPGSPCGPLAERVLAAFLEYDIVSDDNISVNGNNHDEPITPEGTQMNGHREILDMDDRLKRELRALDLMDDQDVEWDDREDDEISIKLREYQSKLREQVKRNNYRKRILLEKVKARSGYQQYINYLDEIDTQIEETYLARHPEKDKSKLSKTKKKRSTPTLEEVKSLLKKRKDLIEGIGVTFEPESQYSFDPGQSIFNPEEMALL